MKKIYSLIAFVAVVLTACQKQPVIPNSAPKHTPSLTLTLAAADYKILGDTSSYAYKSSAFMSDADAKVTIPLILAAKYPLVDDKSKAMVTFAIGTPTIKLADSTYSKVAYTLTNADYLLLPGNKFTDFSAAQILSWLPYKYTSPVANQLAVLTFNYYAGTTTVQTFSYLYLNGAWQQIYMLTPAQYTAVGHSSFNQFTSADAEANIYAYINAILKADLSVAAFAKVGDVKYVSFNYYVSSGKSTYQRVLPLAFDGTNWVTKSTNETLSFARTNGKWELDAAISYTLVKDDYTYIGTQTKAGSDAARANVAQYPDFNISAPTDATYWSDSDLNAALTAVLVNKFKATSNAGQKYIITYTVYSFGKTSNVAKTFVYDGSNFSISTQ
ncbi:hypothetical protein AB6735_03170 [Mucilaginibacter sp. RCC_168]|uniref:hypothetical protein n=1 Tax=Mucilaginibacter sp. RCC_168 TaxID=3239221 RepID=UPI003524464E